MKTKIEIKHLNEIDQYKVSVSFSKMNDKFRGKEGNRNIVERCWTASSMNEPDLMASIKHIFIPGSFEDRDSHTTSDFVNTKQEALEMADGIRTAINTWKKDVGYTNP